MVLLDDSHDRTLHRHGVSIWACFMARLNHPANMRGSGRAVNEVRHYWCLGYEVAG
jgi:hypothetical protein